MFPKAVFTVKDIKRIAPGWLTAPNCQVNGELNLRGVSADLEFDATVSLNGNASFVLEAHFDIDRTRWNVIYGSTRFLNIRECERFLICSAVKH
jgi:polyisoprenoid-binding protein YceI